MQTWLHQNTMNISRKSLAEYNYFLLWFWQIMSDLKHVPWTNDVKTLVWSEMTKFLRFAEKNEKGEVPMDVPRFSFLNFFIFCVYESSIIEYVTVIVLLFSVLPLSLWFFWIEIQNGKTQEGFFFSTPYKLFTCRFWEVAELVADQKNTCSRRIILSSTLFWLKQMCFLPGFSQ